MCEYRCPHATMRGGKAHLLWVNSHLPLWDIGTELRMSELSGECPCLQRHLTSLSSIFKLNIFIIFYYIIYFKNYIIYFDNIQPPLLPLNLSSPPFNFMSSVTFWLSFWVQFVLLGIGKLTDYPSETSTVNGSSVRVGTCASFRSCVQILTDVIFFGSSVNNPSCWAHECRAPLRYRRPYQLFLSQSL